MKKATIIILLVGVCFTMFSCGNPSLKLYEAYVCDDSSSVITDLDTGSISYNTPRQSYKLPTSNTYTKSNTPERSLIFADFEVTLNYQNTYKKPFCEYEVDSFSNESYDIRATFRDDGKLDYFRTGNYDYNIIKGELTSESILIEACNSYLLNFVESLEKYTIKINTKIQTIDEHGMNNVIENGFLTPTYDENSDITYEVIYEYFIDGIKTVEGINISVDSKGFLKSVNLNMINSFEQFAQVDIDEGLVDQIILDEITYICDVDDYEFIKCNKSNVLIILEDKLCVLSYLNPIYNVNNEAFFSESIEMIVPVA